MVWVCCKTFFLCVQCLMPSRCRRSGALPGLLPCSRLCIARYLCLVSPRELCCVGVISTRKPEIRLLGISATLSSCSIQTSHQKLWEEDAKRKRTTVVFASAKQLMRAKMLIGDVNFHCCSECGDVNFHWHRLRHEF